MASGIRLATAIAVLLLGVAACGARLSVSTTCQPDPGKILFGAELATGGTALSNCSTTFQRVGDFAFVGIFGRQVTGTVALQVIRDADAPLTAGGFTFDHPGNLYSGRWHLTDFPGAGNYVINMILNGETLATGSFTLTE